MTAHVLVEISDQLVAKEAAVAVSADGVIEIRAQHQLVKDLQLGVGDQGVAKLRVPIYSPEIGLVGLLGVEIASAARPAVEPQSESRLDGLFSRIVENFKIGFPFRSSTPASAVVMDIAEICRIHGYGHDGQVRLGPSNEVGSRRRSDNLAAIEKARGADNRVASDTDGARVDRPVPGWRRAVGRVPDFEVIEGDVGRENNPCVSVVVSGERGEVNGRGYGILGGVGVVNIAWRRVEEVAEGACAIRHPAVGTVLVLYRHLDSIENLAAG